VPDKITLVLAIKRISQTDFRNDEGTRKRKPQYFVGTVKKNKTDKLHDKFCPIEKTQRWIENGPSDVKMEQEIDESTNCTPLPWRSHPRFMKSRRANSELGRGPRGV